LCFNKSDLRKQNKTTIYFTNQKLRMQTSNVFLHWSEPESVLTTDTSPHRFDRKVLHKLRIWHEVQGENYHCTCSNTQQNLKKANATVDISASYY
jgi:hypothetical protein